MESIDQGYTDDRFAANLDEDLHCAICLNVLKEPLQCQMNEHHFCTPCITRHLLKFQNCPSCLEDLSQETLKKPARYLTKHLNNLDIHCDYETRGCRELIKLKDLKYHVDMCGYAPVPCSNDGCSEVINKQDQGHHETELCKQRRPKCHDCTDMRKEIDHLKMSLENLKIQVNQLAQMMYEMKGIKSKKPNLPNPRSINTNIPKGNIIVVGGYNGVYRLDSVEMFVWSKNEWQPLNNTNVPHSSSSSVVYNNKLLVVGGRTAENSVCADIETMDIDRDVEQLPHQQWLHCRHILPEPLMSHSCAISGETLIVIGGINGIHGEFSRSISEIQLIPPYSSKLLLHLPDQNSFFAAEQFSDKIVIVGSSPNTGCESSVMTYDIQTNQLEPNPPLPYPAHSVTTARYGDHIVVIGGQNGAGKAVNTAMMYNIKNGHTHMLPPMKYKRSSCTAVVIGDIIVVMGGFVPKRRQSLNVVEYFSFASYTWTELAPMREKRSSATAVALPY